MIRIQDMGVVFAPGTPDENVALHSVNLRVNRGDFITIIGSNGAGKTTLFNAISGTLLPGWGQIFLADETEEKGSGEKTGGRTGQEREITREAEYIRSRYIGRIFQNPLLGTAGNMTLEDNMMICSRRGYRGLKISLNNAMRETFRGSLRTLGMGLENRLNDNVELLSGGQRQALTLLMTVMSNPKLLLLDEHTAALDPRNAELVMELTLRFAGEYGLTVMMITHNMAYALRFGNRLLMMDRGEIILDIGGKEKSNLTQEDIIRRFREIKNRELNNDEMLLG